jgi:transposase
VTATAMVATIGDRKPLKNGRPCAAWWGLGPRQDASGGKPRLGRIRERGDAPRRPLMIHGPRRGRRLTAQRTEAERRGAEQCIQRRGSPAAAVALTATHARSTWARLARNPEYRPAA